MKYVNAFYDKYEMIYEKKVEKRTVYLATDEASVLNEATTK